METQTTSLDLCGWSHPVTGGWLHIRPVMHSFNIFFAVSLKRLLIKLSIASFWDSITLIWRHNDILACLQEKQKLTWSVLRTGQGTSAKLAFSMSDLRKSFHQQRLTNCPTSIVPFCKLCHYITMFLVKWTAKTWQNCVHISWKLLYAWHGNTNHIARPLWVKSSSDWWMASHTASNA